MMFPAPIKTNEETLCMSSQRPPCHGYVNSRNFLTANSFWPLMFERNTALISCYSPNQRSTLMVAFAQILPACSTQHFLDVFNCIVRTCSFDFVVGLSQILDYMNDFKLMSVIEIHQNYLNNADHVINKLTCS